MFEDHSKIIEVIERKLNQQTFEHQDKMLRFDFNSDPDASSFEHAVGDVRRATQQRLPDDILRGMYESMHTHDGYESYVQVLDRQRESEYAATHDTSSLEELWQEKDETKFAEGERYYQSSQEQVYTTPSSVAPSSSSSKRTTGASIASNFSRRSNFISGVAPPSHYSVTSSVGGGGIGGGGSGGTRTRTTARDKRVDKAERNKRRREVQKKEMEKRKAIEKQIRASQLARFALRKTNRKKSRPT